MSVVIKMESVWNQKNRESYPSLKCDVQCEVCVVGGGIAGILCAHELSEAGYHVVLLEGKEIGSGQTGKSTAKISVLRDLFYAAQIENYGFDQTKQLFDAHIEAIERYQQIIQKEKIECEFKVVPGYLYSKYQLDLLHMEADALNSLGANVHYIENHETPEGVADALRINHQAQFDPLLFIHGIKKNFAVYEHSQVIELQEHIAMTKAGSVSAKYFVVCTHFPIVDVPGFYFMKMHQERSYALAIKTSMQLDGHYFNVDEYGHSFRYYREGIIVGGENHRTGENQHGKQYTRLVAKAQEKYDSFPFVARWSAQDCMTLDQRAYVGEYSYLRKNWFVVTGFNKWGMCSAMVSAKLIVDQISGKKTQHFFDARRSALRNPLATMQQTSNALVNLSKELFMHPAIVAHELPKNHGGIVEVDGKKVGVYKDEEGKLHIVGLKCPHMGCQLSYNPEEKSWDCPCHGSRFDLSGKLLDTPAILNLHHERKD